MDKLKRNFIFYLTLAVNFYVSPLLMKDTGGAMIFLFLIIPAICFVTAVVYGKENGFDFRFILLAVTMFIPTIFLFYNSTAWIYAIVYGITVLLGILAALPFRKG